jgi:hypothetical protein
MKDKTPEEAVLTKLGRPVFSQRYGTGVNGIPTDNGREIFWPHTARHHNDGFPTS